MARLILVADDSPTIQRRAQGILQGEGFVVETVPNGVAAIRKLPQLRPVLVLADVSMPGKDGYEVCDFVKTSKDLHHVSKGARRSGRTELSRNPFPPTT